MFWSVSSDTCRKHLQSSQPQILHKSSVVLKIGRLWRWPFRSRNISGLVIIYYKLDTPDYCCTYCCNAAWKWRIGNNVLFTVFAGMGGGGCLAPYHEPAESSPFSSHLRQVGCSHQTIPSCVLHLSTILPRVDHTCMWRGVQVTARGHIPCHFTRLMPKHYP
jgi:hypothetical protein